MSDLPADSATAESLVPIDRKALRTLAGQMLARKGLFAVDADVVLNQLEQADDGRVHRWGYRWLPDVIEALDLGDIDPRGRVLLARETPATAMFDGSRAVGAVGFHKGLEAAIAKAQAVGTATVVVRDSHPAGWLTSAILPAVQAGLLVTACSNCGKATRVAPGGPAPVLSEPLWAVGLPAQHGLPVLFDARSAELSLEQREALVESGLPLAGRYAINESSQVVAAETDGALPGLPGDQLGFAVGLAGVLAAGGLSGSRQPIQKRKRSLFGDGTDHWIQVTDPTAFCGREAYYNQVDAALESLRRSPSWPALTAFPLPGDAEQLALAASQSATIQVPADAVTAISELANSLRLTVTWST